MATLLLVTRITRPSAGNPLWGPDDRELQDFEVKGIAGLYWPLEELDRALEVARCESALHTGAWAYEGEDSRGLWQLNVEAHPELGSWNLFDPQINAYFAYQLWSGQGWRPWTCAHELGYV